MFTKYSRTQSVHYLNATKQHLFSETFAELVLGCSNLFSASNKKVIGKIRVYI